MNRLLLILVLLCVRLGPSCAQDRITETQRGAPPVPNGQVEIVLDTDAYNEVDDQFALAFAALSPQQISLKAVTAAPFRNQRSTSFADGMEKSYQEIVRILELLDLKTELACRGAERKLVDSETPVDSPAARKIIELAHETRSGPLYVVGLGAATNIASALLIDPTIEDRIVVVWIGGHPYDFDNALDFNLKQDIAAAQVLFGSDAPLVHIPAGNVAQQLSITLPELADGIAGKSTLCDELYQRVADYRREVTKGSSGNSGKETWKKVIWDIATIAWLVDPEQCVQTQVKTRPQLRSDGTWHPRPNPSNHQLRVAVDLDRSRVFKRLFKSLSGS